MDKGKSITETDIQRRLYQDCVGRGHILVVPNIYLGRYESDLISVTKAGFVHEYEIKISRSDFQADFKKGVYSKYLNNLSLRGRHHWMAKGKHYRLGYNQYFIPNYFWFVCPYDMVQRDEVPEKYGLIYIHQNKYRMKRFNPKRLHSQKILDHYLMKMSRCLMHKVFYHPDKYNGRS